MRMPWELPMRTIRVFMIEALRESGLPADDPSLQKAIVFVSRCQNHKS